MEIEYAFIVKQKTKLEVLLERIGTKSELRLYLEHMGSDFNELQTQHDQFYSTLEQLQNKLSGILAYKILDSNEVGNYFPKNSVVIVFGSDSLVAYTSKYTQRIPIIAVSPTANQNKDILVPFDIDTFSDGLKWVMINNYESKVVNFAEANLDDGQRLLALHDFYIGSRSPRSARYEISFKGQTESQRSSGVVVSTKAGSTEWLHSIFNMAYGITNTFNNKTTFSQPRMNSKHLIFAVREPSNKTGTPIEISAGLILDKEQLIIESQMLMDGVIYSDGIAEDYIDFNMGSKVTIQLSNTYSNLVRNIELPPGFMEERRAFRR